MEKQQPFANNKSHLYFCRDICMRECAICLQRHSWQAWSWLPISFTVKDNTDALLEIMAEFTRHIPEPAVLTGTFCPKRKNVTLSLFK